MVRNQQESACTSLLESESSGEFRRVYVRHRKEGLEVGEFTRGPLTEAIYGGPTHSHCTFIVGVSMQSLVNVLVFTLGVPGERDVDHLLALFFKGGEPFLADLMDLLDKERVSYDYLNSVEGGHVSYRPARCTT